MGPVEWLTMCTRLKKKNLILGQAFTSVSHLLVKLKESAEDWHLSPIWGHSSVHKLFPFFTADIVILQAHLVNTVSQLFDIHLSGGIDKTASPMLMNVLQAFPFLRHKIELFTQSFHHRPFRNKYVSPRTNLEMLMNLDPNYSHRYRLLCYEILDTEIRAVPAYKTSIRGNILM
jgi:hypothetical protein